MKTNLSTVDRVLRFALAFWWLGPFAPQYNIIWINWLVAIVGWIALIESFFCYCWLKEKFGIKS